MGENFDTRMGQASIQYLRHLVQFVTFAAINAKFFGFMGTTFIAPYVYPSQAPYATVAGAFESLEFSIARGLFPLLALGVILLTGITVGRVFCGWACPWDCCRTFSSTFPTRRIK